MRPRLRTAASTLSPAYVATSRSDDRENIFGAFVQDDWKFRPNLTLHAGLRYSYFGPLYNKQNTLPSVQFGTGAATYTGLAVHVGGNLWNAQKGNFGPQVGFNWSPGHLPQQHDGTRRIRPELQPV